MIVKVNKLDGGYERTLNMNDKMGELNECNDMNAII